MVLEGAGSVIGKSLKEDLLAGKARLASKAEREVINPVVVSGSVEPQQ